jgi:hypothetical protein
MEMNSFLSKIFSAWYTEDPKVWTSPAHYFDRPDKLLALFKKWNITSVFDAGCSHRHWIQDNRFAENGITYSGGDVSNPAVLYCNQVWPELSITHHDLTSDPFPEVDLIFSNDVLIHLNNQDKLNFFRNFLNSNVKYLMISHSGNYPHVISNTDVSYDYEIAFPWAPVDWHVDPWNFPEELDFIVDAGQEIAWKPRRLCLWAHSQIQLAVDQIDKNIK